MKNKLLDDENLLNTMVEKIASVMGDIDKRSVEKQLNELDEDTTREIISKIIDVVFNPYNESGINSLRSFLEDIFEKPMVHISDFYKQLSEKFNGKYSPEELELICECEKQLVCSLLEKNDIIETKSCLYHKRYDKNCDPIGVSVAPHADIVDTIKRLSTISKLQKTSIATEI